MDNIRVWIVEDDVDWLRGLAAYLAGERDLEVTLATDRPEAVRRALADGEAPPADVVIMDIMLHGEPEGIVLAEETAAVSGARVVMLTSMEEKELIFRSFQAGAIDYQLKSDFESLPGAVRAAAARQASISPAAAERMREEFRRLKLLEREFEAKKLRDRITPAELQLLEMVDQGYSQSQMADKLVISIRTVKNHINHILKKLKAGGSKEAAQQAKAMGLFDRPAESGDGEDRTP
ncbi:response regulator transcription factor [Cohnella nanjingensis]|uniref:Response regulator transcription factor n=1 Tax=Cohnella nanjingensis TaxID=1387779 RepID=A0A7X0RSJ4_9BACL|nr:response regulator transcription factor [Cohnella nanjingensis]MBB6671434.1 response regulator transcription factor [Cohnella nanjingensis]